MKIAEADSKVLLPKLDITSSAESKETKNEKSPGFMDYLMGAIGEVDKLQKDAAYNAEKLAMGDQSYLHNAMIAYEKANLAMQLTVEVRNRIVESYQEIMRIQM